MERSVDTMHVANVAAKVTAIAEAMPPRWRAATVLDGIDRAAPR